MKSSRRLAIIGLGVAGILLYACNLGNVLFWDDADWVLDNPMVHTLSAHTVGFLFSHDILAGIGQSSNYYRPVLMFTFMANWLVHGSAAWGYHLVNNGLHITNAIGIFLLLEMFLRRRAAALVALVWLIHPLQTEAVTYISGRGDPLSVFLMLSTMLLWLKGRRPWHTVLALGCAIAAILSRETAVLLPGYLTLVLMTWVYREPFWKSLRLSLVRAWPFYAISTVYALLRLTVLNFHNTLNWYTQSNPYTEHISYRLWTFLEVLGVYARIIIVPTGLHMERTLPILTNPWYWGIGFTVVVLGLVGWMVVQSWQGNRLWFFGVGWFFLNLVPSNGILVPINALLYEHWLYFGLVGFFLITVSYGDQLYGYLAARRPALARILIGLGVAYIVFLGVQTIRRNIIWGNPRALYLQILEYSPYNVRVLNNLANLYAGEGNIAKDIEYLERAVQADPTQPIPYYNLANAYAAKKDTTTAIALYRKSIALDPAFHYAYRNLASLYLTANDLAAALPLLQKLHQLLPSDDKVTWTLQQVQQQLR